MLITSRLKLFVLYVQQFNGAALIDPEPSELTEKFASSVVKTN